MLCQGESPDKAKINYEWRWYKLGYWEILKILGILL